MPNVTAQTLNQYIGTDAQGNATTIVAPSMTEACQVYYDQETSDPIVMQCTKQNIKCVLPEILVSFTTEVYDPTGSSSTACSATPRAYTLAAGTQQVFTAIPGEGWEFVKWQIDGVDVEGEEGTKATALLTIPASTSPVVFRAVFQAVVGP
jgi:hypothetical protein